MITYNIAALDNIKNVYREGLTIEQALKALEEAHKAHLTHYVIVPVRQR